MKTGNISGFVRGEKRRSILSVDMQHPADGGRTDGPARRLPEPVADGRTMMTKRWDGPLSTSKTGRYGSDFNGDGTSWSASWMRGFHCAEDIMGGGTVERSDLINEEFNFISAFNSICSLGHETGMARHVQIKRSTLNVLIRGYFQDCWQHNTHVSIYITYWFF